MRTTKDIARIGLIYAQVVFAQEKRFAKKEPHQFALLAATKAAELAQSDAAALLRPVTMRASDHRGS